VGETFVAIHTRGGKPLKAVKRDVVYTICDKIFKGIQEEIDFP